MKWFGIVLILAGISIVSWFGFEYWDSMQSVSKIDGEAVLKDPQAHLGKSESKQKKFDFAAPLSANEAPLDHDMEDGDEIAQLVIPSINLAFNVYWGTGKEALRKGVGMYDSEWTTPPDLGRHTLLSGHRDSVFQPVGDIQEGDSLFVRYKGEDYEYRVNDIWITDEHDRSVIVEKDSPTLTLTTCYPFQFIGSAPDRYIIQAELIAVGDFLNLN